MFVQGSSAFAALTLLELALPAVIAITVVAILVAIVRGATRGAASPPSPGVLEQRLDHLDRLHAAGRITDEERADARARLLGTI